MIKKLFRSELTLCLTKYWNRGGGKKAAGERWKKKKNFSFIVFGPMYKSLFFSHFLPICKEIKMVKSMEIYFLHFLPPPPPFNFSPTKQRIFHLFPPLPFFPFIFLPTKHNLNLSMPQPKLMTFPCSRHIVLFFMLLSYKTSDSHWRHECRGPCGTSPDNKKEERHETKIDAMFFSLFF